MRKPLTENFNLEEFAVSDSYPELADSIRWNNNDQAKAYLLAALFLQPVRNVFGVVRITSGQRPPELNTKIGGAKASDHLYSANPETGIYSAACDFTCRANMSDVYEFLKETRAGTFGQLIHYKTSNFIHVSLPTPKHVGEAWENDF